MQHILDPPFCIFCEVTCISDQVLYSPICRDDAMEEHSCLDVYKTRMVMENALL